MNQTTSALGLILFVLVVSVLLGSPHYDLAWAMVAILTAVALLPVIVAAVFTLWAARLPTRAGPPP
jgi:Na+/proline symporter